MKVGVYLITIMFFWTSMVGSVAGLPLGMVCPRGDEDTKCVAPESDLNFEFEEVYNIWAVCKLVSELKSHGISDERIKEEVRSDIERLEELDINFMLDEIAEEKGVYFFPIVYKGRKFVACYHLNPSGEDVFIGMSWEDYERLSKDKPTLLAALSGKTLPIILAALIFLNLFFVLSNPASSKEVMDKGRVGLVRDRESPGLAGHLREVVRLRRLTSGKEKREGILFSGSLDLDPYRGTTLSSGIILPRGNFLREISGEIGLGNPFSLYFGEEIRDSLGGMLNLSFDEIALGSSSGLLVGARGGLVPNDFSPGQTYFGRMGVNWRTELSNFLLQLYWNAGLFYREVPIGDIGAAGSGLINNPGLRLDYRWGERRLMAGLDYSGSSISTTNLGLIPGQAVSHRAMSELLGRFDPSSLSLRLGYREPFAGGNLDLSGWLRYGPVSANFGPASFAERSFRDYGTSLKLALPGDLSFGVGYNYLLASYDPEQRPRHILRFDSGIVLWDRLSVSGGLICNLSDMDFMPYARVLFEIMDKFSIYVGFNEVPAVYGIRSYRGPFDPRHVIVSVGLKYGFGPVPGRVLGTHSYPAVSAEGAALSRAFYGPVALPPVDLEDKLKEVERRLKGALAKVLDEWDGFKRVVEVFERVKKELGIEDSDALNLEIIKYLLENENITLLWMPYIRRLVPKGKDVYEIWHQMGVSYPEMLDRLVGKGLENDVYLYLPTLKSELHNFIKILEKGLSKKTLGVAANVYDKVMKRLSVTSPRSMQGIFDYYTASQLFSLLVKNGKFPGVDNLLKLGEYFLAIPSSYLKSFDMDIEMVKIPSENFLAQLAVIAKHGFKSKNYRRLYRALLLGEVLILNKKHVIPPRHAWAFTFMWFADIYEKMKKRNVSFPIDKDDQDYISKIKSGFIPLDVVFRGLDITTWGKKPAGFIYIKEFIVLLRHYEALPRSVRLRSNIGNLLASESGEIMKKVLNKKLRTEDKLTSKEVRVVVEFLMANASEISRDGLMKYSADIMNLFKEALNPKSPDEDLLRAALSLLRYVSLDKNREVIVALSKALGYQLSADTKQRILSVISHLLQEIKIYYPGATFEGLWGSRNYEILIKNLVEVGLPANRDIYVISRILELGIPTQKFKEMDREVDNYKVVAEAAGKFWKENRNRLIGEVMKRGKHLKSDGYTEQFIQHYFLLYARSLGIKKGMQDGLKKKWRIKDLLDIFGQESLFVMDTVESYVDVHDFIYRLVLFQRSNDWIGTQAPFYPKLDPEKITGWNEAAAKEDSKGTWGMGGMIFPLVPPRNRKRRGKDRKAIEMAVSDLVGLVTAEELDQGDEKLELVRRMLMEEVKKPQGIKKILAEMVLMRLGYGASILQGLDMPGLLVLDAEVVNSKNAEVINQVPNLVVFGEVKEGVVVNNTVKSVEELRGVVGERGIERTILLLNNESISKHFGDDIDPLKEYNRQDIGRALFVPLKDGEGQTVMGLIRLASSILSAEFNLDNLNPEDKVWLASILPDPKVLTDNLHEITPILSEDLESAREELKEIIRDA